MRRPNAQHTAAPASRALGRCPAREQNKDKENESLRGEQQF
jgi:hypothetical protein